MINTILPEIETVFIYIYLLFFLSLLLFLLCFCCLLLLLLLFFFVVFFFFFFCFVLLAKFLEYPTISFTYCVSVWAVL